MIKICVLLLSVVSMLFLSTSIAKADSPSPDAIVHLIDANSKQEVGTMTFQEWWNVVDNPSSPQTFDGFYAADWLGDSKSGPESPDGTYYTYYVITPDEYEQQVQKNTVIIKYVDLATNQVFQQKTFFVGYLPLPSSAPDGYQLTNVPDKSVTENGKNIVYRYVSKLGSKTPTKEPVKTGGVITAKEAITKGAVAKGTAKTVLPATGETSNGIKYVVYGFLSILLSSILFKFKSNQKSHQ